MVHVVWGLIIASGKSEQLESTGIDTAFLSLGGKPMLYYSLAAMEASTEIDGIAVVAKKERLLEIQQMAQLFGFTKLKKIAAGSTQRGQSLKIGLGVLNDPVSVVAIQDVSRPLVSTQVISDAVKTAKRYGSAVAAARMPGVTKVTKKGFVVESTLEDATVWESQTPLVCKREILVGALEHASKTKKSFKDEAQAIENFKKEIRVVPSSPLSIKIAQPNDLAVAESLLKVI